MKRLIGFALLLSLTACNDPSLEGQEKYKSDAAILTNSVCTEQQMQRVEKETLFCKHNTGYFASDCYVNSMRRVCSRGPAQ